MATTRREFVDRTVGLVGALAVPPAWAAGLVPLARLQRAPAAKPLRILFLGGTGFLGPHMVRHAMAQGHRVTVFNRGRTAPGLFPDVETLIGDRDGKLDALKGHEWDAVIDTSGYVPRLVRDSANLLKDKVGRYVFISTGSVYKFDQPYIEETSELLPITDPKSEDIEKHYGPLKILCEQTVNEIFAKRGTVLRLHVVAGPGDPTDRFTYWPVRIDAGGDVVAPGDPSHPVQFIDVRDLAEFSIHVIERNTPGTFNVAGPTLGPTSMAEFLYGIRATTRTPMSFTWVDEKFLQERKVRYQLWISQNGPARGAHQVRAQRAVAAGLTYRPLAVTAVDTLAWFKAEPADRRQKLTLNLERDKKLLEEWRAR